MVDIIVIVADSDVERMTMHNEALSFLLLEQGRKTEALSITDHTGGGAVNTAIAFQRLGHKAQTLVKIGDDADGARLRDRLHEEHVDASSIVLTRELPTGRAVMVSSHNKDSTIFTQRGSNTLLVPEDLREAAFQGLDLVYITSLSNKSADCFPHIVRMAKDAGARVAVNPGIRQLTSRSDAFFETLSSLDYLSINRVEASALVPMLSARVTLGQDDRVPDQATPTLWRIGLEFGGFTMPLRIFFRAMRDLGIANTVVTDGGKGAYLSTPENVLFCSALDVPVQGTVGAGDSFSATLASGITSGLPPRDAIMRATVNASSVVQHIDAQAGLMTPAEMDATLARVEGEFEILEFDY